MDISSFHRFQAPPPESPPLDWETAKRNRESWPNFMPWRYGRIYQREHGSTDRLCIGADEHQIDLLMALSRSMPEPLRLLYVLHTQMDDHEAGHYESPPVSWEDTDVFLKKHEPFLERDARHDLWIAHPNAGGPTPLLVFDRHNLIYGYGPLDSFISVLQERGFTEGSVSIPMPHAHNYHQEFNDMGDELLAYWPWHRKPLRPQDEQ